MVRDADAKRLSTSAQKWASSATADTVLPESRTPNAIDRTDGWTSEFSQSGSGARFPTREVFNQLFREVSAFIIELNQHGINEWDLEITYVHPATVYAQDTSNNWGIYASKENSSANLNQNPNVAASAFWELFDQSTSPDVLPSRPGSSTQDLILWSFYNSGSPTSEWDRIDRRIQLAEALALVNLSGNII